MLNRVILIGRITKDIETRKTQSGISVTSFTVAVNRRQSKEAPERQADFINCVAWRQTADYMGMYAKKGALISVEGRIQTRNYEGMDGKRVYVTEVLCESIQLLESRNASINRNNEDMIQFNQNESVSYEADNNFDDFGSGISLDISSDDLPF